MMFSDKDFSWPFLSQVEEILLSFESWDILGIITLLFYLAERCNTAAFLENCCACI